MQIAVTLSVFGVETRSWCQIEDNCMKKMMIVTMKHDNKNLDHSGGNNKIINTTANK